MYSSVGVAAKPIFPYLPPGTGSSQMYRASCASHPRTLGAEHRGPSLRGLPTVSFLHFPRPPLAFIPYPSLGAGQGNFDRGMQRTTCAQPCHGLWRYPRAIFRSTEALRLRRGGSSDQLHFYGRLCGPRPQQCRDPYPPIVS